MYYRDINVLFQRKQPFLKYMLIAKEEIFFKNYNGQFQYDVFSPQLFSILFHEWFFLMKSIIQCIMTLCTLIQRFHRFSGQYFFTTLFYIKSLCLSQRFCQFHQILSVSLFCLLVGEIFWIYTFYFSNLRTIRSVYL